MKKGACCNFFALCIKSSECNSIECNSFEKLIIKKKNGDVTLNRAKDYYENNKERIRGQARDKYWNVSAEEKDKKR